MSDETSGFLHVKTIYITLEDYWLTDRDPTSVLNPSMVWQLVILDGSMFQSPMVLGKKEFLYMLVED